MTICDLIGSVEYKCLNYRGNKIFKQSNISDKET